MHIYPEELLGFKQQLYVKHKHKADIPSAPIMPSRTRAGSLLPLLIGHGLRGEARSLPTLTTALAFGKEEKLRCVK